MSIGRECGKLGGAAAAAMAVMTLLSSCDKPTSKDVAATVNGRPISFKDLDRAIAEQFPNAPLKANSDQTLQLRLETLRSLIDNQILLQRSEKEGLIASDADVDAKFSELKTPYTEEQFQKHLTELKLTAADLKAQLRVQISVDKLVNKEIGSHIAITDAEVSAFYNANKPGFNLAENKIRLAQLLVTSAPDPNITNLKNSKAQNDQEAKNKIQMLEMRVRQGEDFASLAQNYSEDQFAANGGDVGFIPESTLDKANPELRKIILNMTPGQVSQVIHTTEGYRIIKLISRELAGQRQLEDPRVQEEIRRELFAAKQQLLRSAYYEVVRSEAKIVNFYARSVLDSRDRK